VSAQAPVEGVAESLVGACFQRAFLLRFSAFSGHPEHDPDPADGFAAGVVAAVLPALTPTS
ncbi:MAG: hypothetical protein ACRDSH_02190, partial [Pseudonocardiaceae bacterium]